MNINSKTSTKVTVVVIVLFAATAFMQQGAWKAPASADQKKNTVPSNEQTLAAGKILYNKECASCHGKKGKGDGPAAIALSKPAGDLSSVQAQAQSDGAHFWKITEGKAPMPTFKKKFTEEQVWQIVNYIRTFTKK